MKAIHVNSQTLTYLDQLVNSMLSQPFSPTSIRFRVNNYLKLLLQLFTFEQNKLHAIFNLRCESLLSNYNIDKSVIQSASHYNIQSASFCNRQWVGLTVSYSDRQWSSQPGNIIYSITAFSQLVLQLAIHYDLHAVSHCNRKPVCLTVIYLARQSISQYYNIQPVSHYKRHQLSERMSHTQWITAI